MSKKSLLSSFLLIILFLLIVGIKVGLSFQNPGLDLETGKNLYATEAAIQYSYSFQIAQGNSIPDTDYRLQYPEGVDTRTDLTLFMEYLAGIGYRWVFQPLTGISFPRYAILFISFFSSLPIFLVYIAGAEIFKSRVAAWIATLVYGLHPFFYLRVIGNFGRENVALFFIFGSMVGLLCAFQTEEWRSRMFIVSIFLAVLAQLAAFAAWHVSRFVFEVQVILFAVLYAAGRFNDVQKRALSIWVGTAFVFCFLLPELRSRLFFFSPGMLVGLALAADVVLSRKWQTRWRFLPLGVLTLLLIVVLPRHGDSHVMSILLDKVRFLFSKPDDPTLLSWESRAMWIEAFHSPTIEQLVYFLSPAFLAITAGISLDRQRVLEVVRGEATREFLTLSLLAFGTIFLFFFRFHGFFLFFLSLLIGGVLGGLTIDQGGKRWTGIGLATGLLLSGGYQVVTLNTGNALRNWTTSVLSPAPKYRYTAQRQSVSDLLDWIEEYAEPDQSFVGSIGMMATVYTESNRPVVVQPKFENPLVREKYKEFTTALFTDDEEDLDSFCRAYDVDYIVYEAKFLLDEGPDSYRYLAGVNEVASDSNAYRMQFDPFLFLSFELVYQNADFRVYQFLKSEDQVYRNLPIGYEPLFDIQFFDVELGEIPTEEQIGDSVQKAGALYATYAASLGMLKQGNVDQAERLLLGIVSESPGFYRAWLRLAEINVLKGKPERALAALDNVEIGYPGHPEAKALREKLTGNSIPEQTPPDIGE